MLAHGSIPGLGQLTAPAAVLAGMAAMLEGVAPYVVTRSSWPDSAASLTSLAMRLPMLIGSS